ncbi:thioredoxin family protein [candidate division KSB1 bacterium]|jgi:small redox-active disulfide protein 2|nr:thioredoxin family protein [candidate division KSB1 bacterium]
MNIKVLGSGCSKCNELEKRVRQVAESHHIEIDLEKVTAVEDIMSYGVMITPGLVIDGNVKSSGKLPSKEEILEWIS